MYVFFFKRKKKGHMIPLPNSLLILPFQIFHFVTTFWNLHEVSVVQVGNFAIFQAMEYFKGGHMLDSSQKKDFLVYLLFVNGGWFLPCVAFGHA